MRQFGQCIGPATSEQAQMKGIISGMQMANKYIPREVHCFSDNQSFIDQLNGTGEIRKHSACFSLLEKEIENIPVVSYQYDTPAHPLIKTVNQLLEYTLEWAENLTEEEHYLITQEHSDQFT